MTGEALTARLLRRDPTLWPEGNVSHKRLGWLDAPERFRKSVRKLERFAASVDSERILLLGMGGSSLGPLVLSRLGEGRPVEVLDTTAPGEVARATEDLSNAFIVVSSKSGTTLEVQSLLARCWALLPDPQRYVVVTDPGSPLTGPPLEGVRVFENDPDIGGRYSVLSYFGLVPAALTGMPLGELLDGAASADLDEAVGFGVSMAEAARAGRDKLTIGGHYEFGLWVEQLVAESTGKGGKGIIPVPVGDESEGGADRHVVNVDVGSPAELGREFYRWMVATAVAGSVLDIDPFDEPDVAAAKEATGAALAELPLPDEPGIPAEELPSWLAAQVREGDYVSLQAYLPYGSATELEDLRRRCRDVMGGMAVTAGFGPRFLHSTGQLHKGGPNSVVAVQILPDDREPDIDIPGAPYGFSTLIDAQALGDFRTLKERGRRVVRVASSELDHLMPA